MAINHKELKKALQIMDRNPVEIQNAQSHYNDIMADLEKKKDYLAPVAIRDKQERAKRDRDRIIKAMCDEMKTALEVVEENSNFGDEQLDIKNPALMNALSIINTLGNNLGASEQLSILESFRGDVAALNFISTVFDKYGLYFADHAREMAAPVKYQAMIDAASAIGWFDYTGEFDMNRMRWTKNEFRKLAQRLGYDSGESYDPFIAAFESLRSKAAPSANDSLELKRDKEYLSSLISKSIEAVNEADNTNLSKAEVFNNMMREIERREADIKAKQEANENSDNQRKDSNTI